MQERHKNANQQQLKIPLHRYHKERKHKIYNKLAATQNSIILKIYLFTSSKQERKFQILKQNLNTEISKAIQKTLILNLRWKYAITTTLLEECNYNYSLGRMQYIKNYFPLERFHQKLESNLSLNPTLSSASSFLGFNTATASGLLGLLRSTHQCNPS